MAGIGEGAGQLDRLLGGDAGILGDAAIGIGAAGPGGPPAPQPIGGQPMRQPGAPVQRQVPPRLEVQEGDDGEGEGDDQQHAAPGASTPCPSRRSSTSNRSRFHWLKRSSSATSVALSPSRPAATRRGRQAARSCQKPPARCQKRRSIRPRGRAVGQATGQAPVQDKARHVSRGYDQELAVFSRASCIGRSWA